MIKTLSKKTFKKRSENDPKTIVLNNCFPHIIRDVIRGRGKPPPHTLKVTSALHGD